MSTNVKPICRGARLIAYFVTSGVLGSGNHRRMSYRNDQSQARVPAIDPRRNPYGDLDQETAAAIAQQQSIYSSDNRENAKLKQAERIDLKSRHKTVIREGGGKVWEDPTLLEWDPAHFRVYCGNLGGEVNDESLHRAFSAYPSIVKARVVRDKKTTKSKGFGFVSFKEPDDMLNAWRDLNGKYIGSHPVKLTKAETSIKATAVDRTQLKSKQAKSAFSQNQVKAGRVEKKKVVTSSGFMPRGMKRV